MKVRFHESAWKAWAQRLLTFPCLMPCGASYQQDPRSQKPLRRRSMIKQKSCPCLLQSLTRYYICHWCWYCLYIYLSCWHVGWLYSQQGYLKVKKEKVDNVRVSYIVLLYGHKLVVKKKEVIYCPFNRGSKFSFPFLSFGFDTWCLPFLDLFL